MSVTQHLALVLALIVTGCSGSSTPASPSGSSGAGSGGSSGGGSGGSGGGPAITCVTGSMSAVIDGLLWQACNPVSATNDRRVGAIAIAGSDLDTSTQMPRILFGFGVPSESGTFTSRVTADLTTDPGVACWWHTDLTGGSARVTVTTFDTTVNRVAGTFDFTLVPSPACPGSAGSKRVTQGVFDVTFTSQN